MDRLFLIMVTGVAAIWDLRTRKIPNVWIINGLVIGLLIQIERYGTYGIWRFVSGSGVPLLLLAILFYFRMLGAGDIKLLAVIGGFLGLDRGLRCVAVSFLLGALYSLFLLIRRGIFRKRLSYFLAYIGKFYRTGTWKAYRTGTEKEAEFCFSIPIFISVLVTIQ